MATVIFLCDEKQYSGVRQEINAAKVAFSKGNFYDTGWSAGNVTKIQVGDRAYLRRTGSYPHGFFAAGKVVAAPEKEQLECVCKQMLQDAARLRQILQAYPYHSDSA